MGENAKLELKIQSEELKSLVEKNSENLKKDTGLSEIKFEDNLEGEEIKVGDDSVTAKISK